MKNKIISEDPADLVELTDVEAKELAAKKEMERAAHYHDPIFDLLKMFQEEKQ